ncbi:MAG TPA: nucleotide exchange factor GrpE [Gammaproteobacteria bacterium]|nr:nucleotide exchange factor GrpE [Gammaproteobacteria bacterium]
MSDDPLDEQTDGTPTSPPSISDRASEHSAARLATAEGQAAEERERALRLAAEMENLRRRTARDVEQARRYALERFAAELLPVADSLDLALGSAEAAPPNVREGLEMTLKLLHDIFARHHLEAIDPTGERFDPEFHEAIATQPTDQIAPDHVVTVVQKGFRLHDRLLRPARVIVSRSPE